MAASMAIDDLLDEHEQSEHVRTWLRDNGAGLIGGIALGLALIGGWQWWQKQQAQQAGRSRRPVPGRAGCHRGQGLKQAAAEGRGPATASTPPWPRCELAKAQVDAGQRDAAIATLRAVKAGDPAIAAVVDAAPGAPADRCRQGRRGAEAAASTATDASRWKSAATRSSRSASATGPRRLPAGADPAEVGSPQRRLLELKLTEVGGTPAKPEAKS